VLLSDAVLAAGVPILLSVVRFGPGWETPWEGMLPDPWFFLSMYVAVWLVLLWARGLYRQRAHWTIASEARAIAAVTLAVACVSFGVLYLLRLPEVSRLFLIVLFPTQAVALIGGRFVVRSMRDAWVRRRPPRHAILVVGTGAEAVAFARQVADHPELGLGIVGLIGEPPPEPVPWPYLGALEGLREALDGSAVDEVAICLPFPEWHRFEAIVDLCTTEGKLLRVPLHLPPLLLQGGHVDELDDTLVLSLGSRPERALGLALKRLVDIVGSACGLVLLSPLLLVSALAILVRDGRPILFRQTRVGLQGRHFQIVKFRTMRRDADAGRAALRAKNEVQGAAFKLTDDPRVTPLGRFLRRTSIDELPQLWNVLRGDMSLVGPRPHPLDDVAGYDLWHRRRLSMKPGMTGLWQVRARRERDFDAWVQRDLEYIDGWSLWLDLRLLLSTIPAVLRSEGR
jgi:exopolysaccharide biosynthesis polyprenyl glycosylphosphotransferase